MAQTQARTLHLDTREWLDRVDAMGELRRMDGASWQEDIGRVTEMLHHTDDSPAVLFDNIPGYPQGQRLLVNANGNKNRLSVTLGFDPQMNAEELKAWFIDKMENMTPRPVQFVDSGPVTENVLEGDAVDVLKFPVPKWHPEDGGRYIGTGSVDHHQGPRHGLGQPRHLPRDGARRQAASASTSRRASTAASTATSTSRSGEPMPVAHRRRRRPAALRGEHARNRLRQVSSTSGWRHPRRAAGGDPRQVHRPADPRQRRDRDRGLRPPGRASCWRAPSASGPATTRAAAARSRSSTSRPSTTATTRSCSAARPRSRPYEAHRYRIYLRSALIQREIAARRRAGRHRRAGATAWAAAACSTWCRSSSAIPATRARRCTWRRCAARAPTWAGYVIVVDDDIDISDLERGDVGRCPRARIPTGRSTSSIAPGRARSTRPSTPTRRGSTRGC